MSNTRLKTLKLSEINRDVALQARVGMSEQTIEDYAECYRRGISLPAPSIFSDGQTYWPWDGFHRLEGLARTEETEIVCEIGDGTFRDALFLAASANKTHGLRRTNEDKRKAVAVLLTDEEWGLWANRRIADHCGVSDVFVGNLRREHGAPEPELRSGSDGRSIKTGNIGRPRSPGSTANRSQSTEGTEDSTPPPDATDATGPSSILNICGRMHSTPSRDERVEPGTIDAPLASAPPSLATELQEIHRTLTLVLERLPGSDPEAAEQALARLITDANDAHHAKFFAGGDE
jgi:hypothetical protein